MNVTLGWWELRAATLAALDDMTFTRLEGNRQNAGQPGYVGDWLAEVGTKARAYAAEISVAKSRGFYWPPPHPASRRHDGDVVGPSGPVEVRHTVRPDGRLIVRPSDPDDRLVVLVRGDLPVFEIAGSILIGQAKEVGSNEAPNGRPPCWFVDASDLSWRPV